MMEKYYTPDISEFHVGFEFEYLLPLFRKGETPDWVNFNWKSPFGLLLTERCISIGGITIKTENIHVKYLDKEDIESLGWKWSENDMHFEIGDYVLSGQYAYQNVEIEQYHEDWPNGGFTSWYEKKFYGKIKNKSELKKLMEQLQIK